MNKKDKLEKLFLENETLTSKEVTDLGYQRIYLTMLEKEKKIYKLARGVYSCDKDNTSNELYEFQRHNKKIIYSCFTALDLLNFYHSSPNKKQISVPQGYNATRYNDYETFYNNLNNYGEGKQELIIDNKIIEVYNLERSICDIIKERNRFDSREYNKLINYYFNLKEINYPKLLEYSKLLKVSKKVQNYLSLFKA